METILIPNPITSIEIFSSKYENDECVFFHGTSSLYSNHIEKFGLMPNHKALSNHYYRIHQLAEKIFFFTNNKLQFSEFNTAVKDSMGYLKVFTRISFSAVSLCAAKYSFGETSGGQGLRHLRNLINTISVFDFNSLENAEILISESEKYHFIETKNLIANLKNVDGVVYAFKFEPKDIINLHYETHVGHNVLLTIDHVIPEKIVAKMMIPNTTVFSDELIKAANDKTQKLGIRAYSTEYIKKIIQSNSERIDSNILNGSS